MFEEVDVDDSTTEGAASFLALQFPANLYPSFSASSTELNLTWFFSETLEKIGIQAPGA